MCRGTWQLKRETSMIQTRPSTGRLRLRSKRLATLMVAMTGLLTAWMSTGPISSASAINTGQYCWGANVPGWGQCSAPYIQPLVAVFGKGGQHAACTNAYWLGALVSSWACAGTNEWASITYNGSRLMAGAVRNNAASSNVLYGEMWW